jgi:hypothetical protein
MPCGCHLHTFLCNKFRSIGNVVSVVPLADFEYAHKNKGIK